MQGCTGYPFDPKNFRTFRKLSYFPVTNFWMTSQKLTQSFPGLWNLFLNDITNKFVKSESRKQKNLKYLRSMTADSAEKKNTE